ncbi:MAG: hypothetical protein Q4G24_01965 [Paracoccus sp. (in: a-proteobacteria)]|uniref:hypothetical protein n=1 Tax=Paracoccus sp. TaxID=267 RepID=UPI0026E0AF88|nr:hypothetical protein [Paracoccus sp. (in: a-proteobacteria)]MDO5620217.1 hypothetical protein [Paracoccus sp. (in: a-proteobacteria)]
MSNVAALAIDEPVRVDARRVDDIVCELGELAARNVIGLALEQMALTLHMLDTAQRDGELTQIVTQADRLAQLAWQVGLVSLSGIAIDAGECVRQGNHAALAAVLARLMRVGNRSLTEIWEVRPWD